MTKNLNIFGSTNNVALLIDGENISSSLADAIMSVAVKLGEVTVKRIYGNFRALPSWEAVPGYRQMHSGIGRNSADMLLAIEAMELASSGLISTFAIATSDGDFGHLATHLRESGFNVIGIGEEKAPDSFRKSCTKFEQIDHTRFLIRKISEAIANEPGSEGILLSKLSAYMHSHHKVKIGSYPEKTWRNYLHKRPEYFAIDPKGPNARVKLQTGNRSH
ncbi:MAG: NYN domain-containing protein [Paracoccaceae bacterium]